MERIFQYIITAETDGMKISDYLKLQGYSRQNVVALKKMPESILVNGRWEYVSYRLRSGETLTIHLNETETNEKIVPVSLPLYIVYEDEDILVVNKPADMPIHPSINNYENTLANAVSYYYDKQNIPFVFRCINRLDRDTTGLTIIAKHMVAAGILSDMVAKREIHREYLALVGNESATSTASSGKTDSAMHVFEPHENGTVDAPIARVSDSVIERQVDFENGERAVTHYQVLNVKNAVSNEKNGYALLSLKLETGRTHQIRVHMKYLGHPLLGDSLYGGNTSLIQRQALHSYKLTFTHPITKKSMCFTADLPDDMKQLV